MQQRIMPFCELIFSELLAPVWDIFLMVFGGFVAVLITDYIKKPKLVIDFGPGGHQGGVKHHAYLEVIITNKKFNFFGLNIDREAAVDCSAFLETIIVSPNYTITGIKLKDEESKRRAYRLRWEVELSSKLEPKMTVYSAFPQKLRLVGKIQDEAGYFTYNVDDVLSVFEAAKYHEAERDFVLTISDIKGNTTSRKFKVINSGLNINNISISG